MTGGMAAATAEAKTRVPVPADRAYAAFTVDLGSWWPPEFTWSQAGLEWIGIEPRLGGLCTEIGPHGFRVDWGRVLAWEPPDRLVLSWQISPERVPEPDPAKAGEVEVRFAPQGPDATEVAVVHSGFDRHGEGGAAYRAAMAEQGWPLILGRYAASLK